MNIKITLALLAGASITNLCAQQVTDYRNVISIHAGPSHYWGTMPGISSPSAAYQNRLRNGMAWDLSYYRLLGRGNFRFVMGVRYQGNHYAHSDDTHADRLTLHYITPLLPQMGFCKSGTRYAFFLTAGIGAQTYSDASTVYGKSRDVKTGGRIALNIGANAEYCFTPRWGVSARMDLLNSGSYSYRVTYHGQRWLVDKSSVADFNSSYNQISLKIGINYHF